MPSYLFSWNKNSEGAKVLADALKIKRIRHEGSTFKGSSKKTVINWGSSNLPDEVLKSRVLNDPKAVQRCSNKLTFFNTVSGKISHPEFTTSFQEAMKWITDGHKVCARQVLQGHSAEGLVIMHKDDVNSFVEAPLYTKYVKKLDEYRIHVVNNAVTDVQRKALKTGWTEENPGEKPNWSIRNHANGFVYIRQGFAAPNCVLEEAVKTIQVVGLDFGAVDVIYNNKYETAYVLEVNTAPGIEGTSVENYVAAFRDMGV